MKWPAFLLVLALGGIFPALGRAQPFDLMISQAKVRGPGTVDRAGATFQIEYTLRNDQALVSSSVQVGFSYCAQNVAATCVSLGSQTVAGPLKAGYNFKQTSGTLTLPGSVVQGARFIRVLADAGGAVSEINEQNNDVYVGITISAPPDLAVSAVKAPPSGGSLAPGGPFTTSYTLSNAPSTSAVATPFSVSYSFCPQGGGCTLLGSDVVSGGLHSGASLSRQSSTLTLPGTAKQGSHTLKVQVDSTGAVSEANETNNSASGSVTVNANLPDLSVSTIVVPHSGSTAGAGSSFTARYTVRNNTQVTLSKAFTVAFSYCPDASQSGCTALGNQTLSTTLAGGSSTTFTSPTLALPVNVAVGARVLRVLLDSADVITETNEVNNAGIQAMAITAKPDIYVSTATVPASGSTAGPGSAFKGQYIITNRASTSAVTAAVKVDFHYCPTASASGCTALNKSLTLSSGFNAGTAVTVTTPSLTLPAGAKPGTRWILAKLDSAGAVAEANEQNNLDLRQITVGGTQADYAVAAFAAVASGSTVTYNARVCNAGASPSKSIVVRLYFDRATEPGCGDAADHTWNIGILGAGACSPMTRVRPKVAPGSYQAWVLADGACADSEASEKNNTASSSYTVKALPDAGADRGVADAGVDRGGADRGGADRGSRDAADEGGWMWPDLWPDGPRTEAGSEAGAGLVPTESGCGCRAGGGGPGGGAALALALLALIGHRRRRA